MEAYLDFDTIREKIPTVQLLELTHSEIKEKINDFLKLLHFPNNSSWKYEICETKSLTGGGALPELPIESVALVLWNPERSANELQNWFRSQSIPVIVRIHDEKIWLDFRTILPHDNDELREIISTLISA